MPDDDKAEKQLALMQRMVDLSVERTELAVERTKMSAERSDMSAERSRMSAERSEMSAERSYMNAERTLSVWVRTALSLMVFGIAIDRFGLLLRQIPPPHGRLSPNDLSTWGGAALVAFGVLMSLTTGVRFLAYVAAYRRNHEIPVFHGPFLAPVFALLVAVFGIALLILLLVVAE